VLDFHYCSVKLDRFTRSTSKLWEGQPLMNTTVKDPQAPWLLEIRLLAAFTIRVNGQAVLNLTARAAILIQFLALQEEFSASVVRIAKALWPERAFDAAINSYNGALHEARHALVADWQRNSGVLILEEDVLRLGQRVWVDLYAAKVALVNAKRSNKISDYRNALAFDTGSFLDEHKNADWCASEREHWRGLAASSWLIYARLAADHDPNEAIQAYQRSLAYNDIEEVVHLELFELLAEQGHHQAAQQQHNLLLAMLEPLGAKPGPETVASYQRWLNASIANNIPVFATKLFGRRAAIEAISASSKHQRLISLVGLGGVGKTRLAAALASQWLRQFPDGVWFIALAAIHQPALIVGKVLQTINIQPQNQQTPLAALLEYLADKRLLLVFDNCEHLLGEVGELLLALWPCQGVQLLVTSRLAVGLDVEHCVEVEMLEFVSDNPHKTTSAVQLFLERAKMVRPAFDGRSYLAEIRQICQMLLGWPLAIELAAARVKIFTPAQIASQLATDALGTLTGQPLSPFSAEERHSSLQKALMWSFALLNEEEREVFGHLAVCVGGADLAMLRAVCGPIGEGMMVATVSALYDHALIVAEDRGGIMRYDQLEPVRQFAMQYLPEDRLLSAKERHLEYCVEMVKQMAGQIQTQDHAPKAKLWFMNESENWRAAIHHSFAVHSSKTFGIIKFLWIYWDVTGQYLEGYDYHLKLIEDIVFAQQSQLTTKERAVFAEIINSASGLALYLGKLDAAEALVEQGRQIWLELDDQWGAALIQINLATAFLIREDSQAALGVYSAIVDVLKQNQDHRNYCITIINIGLVLIELGDLDKAQAKLSEAKLLAAQLDSFLLCQAEVNLGLLAIQRKDPQATALLQASLGRAQAVGIQSVMAYALEGLAELALSQDPSAGLRWLAAGARLRQDIALVFPPNQQRWHQQRLQRAQAQLGGQYDLLWQAGSTTPLEHIIEEALRPPQLHQALLSSREHEVAQLASKGLTDKEIAERLGMKPRTVSDHVSNALKKLGLRKRVELGSVLVEAGGLTE
jgi:predicted ATPase/DNA-binding CsgD family transcriptional regulator/DNA-binding SARP family transcriptional activator